MVLFLDSWGSGYDDGIVNYIMGRCILPIGCFSLNVTMYYMV